MVPEWLLKWSIPPKLVIDIATAHNLDPKLVMAIVQQESTGQTCATRHEKGYPYLHRPADYFQNMVGQDYNNEVRNQETSWGPMQIMGATARWLGFNGEMAELCKPSIGIRYGCKYVRWQMNRYEKTIDVVAAYNAGSARYKDSGVLENEQYVDKVMRYYREIKGP
jgi:soluble lytic murein transglycosylase-like protein